MKILIQYLLLFLLTFSVLVANSQNTEIKGEVVDSKSGEALIGVHIALIGDTHGAITDYDGDFVLKTNKTLPLSIKLS